VTFVLYELSDSRECSMWRWCCLARVGAGWVGVEMAQGRPLGALGACFARVGIRRRRWGACERWCSGGD